jgi:hypothetical protein
MNLVIPDTMVIRGAWPLLLEDTYVRTFGRGVRLSLLRRHSVLAVMQLEHGSLRSHFTFLAWQESHCLYARLVW